MSFYQSRARPTALLINFVHIGFLYYKLLGNYVSYSEIHSGDVKWQECKYTLKGSTVAMH